MPKVTKDYSEISPKSRDDLISILKKSLSSRRFEHCLRVEKTARTLAKQYGTNVEKAGLAGLLHDYAKERPKKDFKNVIVKYKLPKDLLKYSPNIWHGLLGYLLVKDELGIKDEAVLQAIKYHTLAAPKQKFSLLSQIVYMADYIEPNRNFKGIDEVRQLTNNNLQAGVKWQIRHTLLLLIQQDSLIYPLAWEAYNSWIPSN